MDGWRKTERVDLATPEHDQLSQACTLQQLANLASHPCVQDRVESGALRLHAWWFDISSACLLAYSRRAGAYIATVDELAQVG